MKIKAIVFDIGDVLIEEPGEKSREITLKKLGVYNKKNEQGFKKFAMENLKYSRKGKLDYVDFFKKFIKEHNLNKTPEEFISAWIEARKEISKLKKDSLNLLNKLKKNYFIVSFTNTTELNDVMRNEIGIYNYFDINLKSIEEEFMKPEKEAYEILIERLRKECVSPEEIVFVDNTEENLIPAKNLGIKTILFKNAKQLENELIKIGVKI